MNIVIAVTAGYLLDFCFGDPEGLPHPVRLMGKAIAGLERWIPQSDRGKLVGGGLLWLVVTSLSFAAPFVLLVLLYRLNPWVGVAAEAVLCCQVLASKSLYVESMKVYTPLKEGNLPLARQMVGRIVGRDTAALTQTGVIKAAVETVAENTCDGVVAPLICLLIGGAPLGLWYKAVNTLDSMVGYKNQKYLLIGRVSAKMDDAINFVPARIAALLMVVAAGLCRQNGKNAWRIYWRDKNNHTSPNAAHTEAACAGALGIQLAGPAVYGGVLVQKPTIGDALRPVEVEDIKRANHLMLTASLLCFALGITIRLYIWWLGC